MKQNYYGGKKRKSLLLIVVMLVCASAWADTYPLSEAELARRIAAKEQITEVPTIYIDVPGITDEQTLGQVLYKKRKGNADEEEIAPYSTATITVVDNSAVGSKQHLESFTDEVQIKVRGNSTASAGNGKLPYRLKFAKKGADGISHKHDLLGHGYSKRNWTLIANNYDGSLIRNAVTYHVGKYVGMDFCPGYKFVDLVISGLYRGSYMISDHCEVGKNRVDVTNEDTDWYLEFECWGSMADYPYVGQGDGDDHWVSIKNPDADDLTPEQITQMIADVQAWRKNWKNTLDAGNWQTYNDAESFVKFYIANEIVGDLDGYFVIKGWTTPGGKLHWGPLWDKDLAYGNYSDAKDVDKSLADYNKTGFEWVFKNYLYSNKEFLKKAKTIIDQLIADGLYDNLSADIDNIVASMPGSVAQNYSKWNLSNIENGAVQSSNYADHVQSIKTWLSKRITNVQTWIDEYIEKVGGVDDVDNPDEEVTEGLTYLGQGLRWSGNQYEYKYQGSSSSMVTGAIMTIELVSDGTTDTQYYQIYMDSHDQYTPYKSVYWPTPLTITITLTDEDVANMKNNGYMFNLITGGLKCNSITLTGGESGGEGGDNPVVHAQLTDVPTIYISTAAGIDADDWGAASMEVFDSNNMIGGNQTLASGALSVKYKGDGTAEKPSYRLKFSAKTPFLGAKSGSFKQWVLEANDDDPTMLRNGLTKELGDRMGFSFTPGCQYADVYVNETYMGTYQITDRVKVESGRVLASNKNTDWLVEIASQGEVDMRTDGYGDLYVEGSSAEGKPYVIIKNPDPDDMTEAEKEAKKQEVGSYFDSLWADVENNVDHASFVNWYISSEILAAYKQLSDTYAYRDANGGKLFFGPLNGNEKAYGNNPNHPLDMSDIDTEGSYNGMIFTHADYGVMRQKLQDLWEKDWFRQAVLQKWNTIYGTGATTDVLAALKSKLDVLAGEIAQTRLYNYKAAADGGAGWTLDGDYNARVAAIKDYLDTRFKYLDRKFNALAGATSILLGDVNNDGTIDIGDAVTLVNHIIGKPTPVFIAEAADVNNDGTIDIGDAVAIVNIIIGKTSASAPAKSASWAPFDPE